MKDKILIAAFLIIPALLYSQITVTPIATKKKEEVSVYDSTRNFLGKDVYQYVGQELYLKGKQEEWRKDGYYNFVLDMNYSGTDRKKNTYKCCAGYDNSKYDDLAGKYFKVIAVHKHPKEYKQNDYFLELIEKESGDKVFFQYSNYAEASFPFIVTGFFEKQKQLTVGKEFVFPNKYLQNAKDMVTGNPITKTSGQKWKCTDLTIMDKYYVLSLILENSYGEKTYSLYTSMFGENSKVYTAEEADGYLEKFGEEIWYKILDGKVAIGFTKEMATLSWGKPEDINSTLNGSSVNEQWVYGTQYLYFTNGILETIQD